MKKSKLIEGKITLAPTDLSNFLSCRHSVFLDLQAANGQAARPVRRDALLEELRERGHKHERAYLKRLQSEGLTIAGLDSAEDSEYPAASSPEILSNGAGDNRFTGSGLRYMPVDHEGNQARSPEEVRVIRKVVDTLLDGYQWRDKDGTVRTLTKDDILIVAPYNAQVSALAEAMPALAGRIGTVDRFQGQEAPVVIYSMTSSSPDDAPRGMDFLYNSFRFNVATSRARALCILVGSAALFRPDCRTPQQMKLANGFCRYIELSRTVEPV